MRILLVLVCIVLLLSSCGLFRSSYGCPSNGKNVGAEKLLANDPKAIKAAGKAGKFVKQ